MWDDGEKLTKRIKERLRAEGKTGPKKIRNSARFTA
jgi:hypothetical protein